jgi:membrane-associated PAP2 superfamily phosphatase
LFPFVLRGGAGWAEASARFSPLETPMLPKKTTLVLQLAMTFMMALTMSGTLGFIFNGADFLSHWPQTFIIAWPIAFIYTRIINPIAFKIAFKFAPPHKAA